MPAHCRHWLQNHTCYRGAECPQLHDPAHRLSTASPGRRRLHGQSILGAERRRRHELRPGPYGPSPPCGATSGTFAGPPADVQTLHMAAEIRVGDVVEYTLAGDLLVLQVVDIQYAATRPT